METKPSVIDTNPMCRTCAYVMPSESSNTGLRCGRQYFLASPILRKFQRMDNYPVVEADERCSQWRDRLKGVLNP